MEINGIIQQLITVGGITIGGVSLGTIALVIIRAIFKGRGASAKQIANQVTETISNKAITLSVEPIVTAQVKKLQLKAIDYQRETIEGIKSVGNMIANVAVVLSNNQSLKEDDRTKLLESVEAARKFVGDTIEPTVIEATIEPIRIEPVAATENIISPVVINHSSL